jgi:hypothetical protein
MNRLIFILTVVAAFSISCNNQQPKEEEDKDLLPTDLVNNPRSATGTSEKDLQSLAIMSFRDTVHDFGSIKEGEVVSYDFEFINTGKSPLVISSANGSCGCTVADFPREPVAPGKSGSVKVQFSSAGREGHQEKSVTLVTNAIRGNRVLSIKGEVKK